MQPCYLSKNYDDQWGAIRQTPAVIRCAKCWIHSFGLSLSMLLYHTCINIRHAYMGVQMYANKHTHNTHKHGCCSSNLLCYRADVTAPITITGPNLHHKTQEGPNPAAPRGLVRNPQVRQRKRQKEGTSTTLILTFRL